jgi:hypothetical protein
VTNFGCHIESKQGFVLGVGVGQQDLKIISGEGEHALFGIGSIGEIVIPLEVEDPKFDIKCRARGLDPDTIKKKME